VRPGGAARLVQGVLQLVRPSYGYKMLPEARVFGLRTALHKAEKCRSSHHILIHVDAETYAQQVSTGGGNACPDAETGAQIMSTAEEGERRIVPANARTWRKEATCLKSARASLEARLPAKTIPAARMRIGAAAPAATVAKVAEAGEGSTRPAKRADGLKLSHPVGTDSRQRK
jgi:hypothetical protein